MVPSTSSLNQKTNLEFLSGGGEMGALTRDFDWSSSLLGPVDQWSASLRTTLSILLNSKFPMFLWWGDELIQFYNDAYRPSLGNNGKHPLALGQKGVDCWQEIWPYIKPLIDQVLNGGTATWSEDQLLPIYRNGKLEDVYWTFSYSPVKDESGKVAGVLVVCNETTDKVLSQDQLRFAIDSTELGTWEYNPLTNKFTSNDRLKDWFGLPAKSDIDLTLAVNIMATRDRERVVDAIQKALTYETGGLYDIEYSIVHLKTKEERIVRARGRAWFNEEKIAYKFNGTLQDITETTLARRKIEDSEQRVRTIIQSAPFPIGVFTGDEMKIEFANKSLLDVYEQNENILGKNYSDVRKGEDVDEIFKQLQNVYKSGIAFHATNKRVEIVKGGMLRPFYFNYSFTPLFDSDGKVYGVMNTAANVTELNLAKEKVEKSESNIRNVIAQAPVAMCIFRGNDLVVEIANERMFEIWGKQPEDIINKPIFTGLSEARNQGFEEILANVFNTGKTYKAFEVPVQLPRNGEIATIYVDFVFEALRDSSGKISGVIAVAVEVTEKVIARKKIEESEQRFKSMVLNAPVSIGLTNGKELIIENINSPMLKLINRESDVIGKSLLDILPELKGQFILDALYKVFDSGESFQDYELPVFLNNGNKLEERFFNVAYSALKENGQITSVLHVMTDVTEQVLDKRKIESAELLVRNTAERLQLALDAGNLGSYELNLAGGNIDCTEQFKKNFGLRTKDPFDYDKLMSIIIPSDRDSMNEAVTKSIKEHSVFNAEYRIKWEEDGIRWIRAAGKPVYDEIGKPFKMVGITLDITEQKLFAEELSKQVKERTIELHSSNEDLLRFAHVASHDLKEPVRKIKTFSLRLHDEFNDVLPNRGKEYLQKIQHATERMFSMIEGVLTYSALSATNQIKESVDINDILTNIENDLELLIQQKNGTISRTKLPVIEGASVLIYQLFYNLMNNSFKFSKPEIPAQINISSSIIKINNQKCARIIIADNGIGIDPQYKDQIFNAFERLHSKDKYEGTGLGLALCKKIAERHSGTIELSGSANDGAIFTIILPLKQTAKII